MNWELQLKDQFFLHLSFDFQNFHHIVDWVNESLTSRLKRRVWISALIMISLISCNFSDADWSSFESWCKHDMKIFTQNSHWFSSLTMKRLTFFVKRTQYDLWLNAVVTEFSWFATEEMQIFLLFFFHWLDLTVCTLELIAINLDHLRIQMSDDDSISNASSLKLLRIDSTESIDSTSMKSMWSRFKVWNRFHWMQYSCCTLKLMFMKVKSATLMQFLICWRILINHFHFCKLNCLLITYHQFNRVCEYSSASSWVFSKSWSFFIEVAHRSLWRLYILWKIICLQWRKSFDSLSFINAVLTSHVNAQRKICVMISVKTWVKQWNWWLQLQR